VRDDWLFVDSIRSFMPNWLARATSLKVVGIAVLALLVLVIALKAGR
jgi:hypothetical protein